VTERPTTPEEEPEATADSQAPAPPTGTPQDAEHARPEAAPEAGSGVGPDAGRPAPQAGGAEGGEEVDDLAAAEAEMDRARADVAALTQDLQRLQAEYVNYKRRVDRDRQLIAENATFKALTPIVEVLDAIDRAREAGELEGGFKAVAEQLERAVASAGLTKFAEPGDPFDPNRHDALSHLGEDPAFDVTTIKMVAKAGYAIGDRVVRAAQVLVVEPAAGSAAEPPPDGSDGSGSSDGSDG
jgi:molecular chaperone GrpE